MKALLLVGSAANVAMSFLLLVQQKKFNSLRTCIKLLRSHPTGLGGKHTAPNSAVVRLKELRLLCACRLLHCWFGGQARPQNHQVCLGVCTWFLKTKYWLNLVADHVAQMLKVLAH